MLKPDLLQAVSTAVPDSPLTQSPTTQSPRAAVAKPTHYAKRVALTVYFVGVTFLAAFLACSAIVVLRFVLWWRLNRSKFSGFDRHEELWQDFEEHRGRVVDAAVWSVMYVCRPWFRVRVMGPSGRPSQRVSKEEWSEWCKKHSSVRGDIMTCPLPRDSEGNIKMPPGCLVMSNHLSNIDGFSIKSSMFGSCSKAIMKYDVAKVPVIGWLVRLSGEPLVRFNKSKGGWGTDKKELLLSRCVEIVKRQFPLIVYPEGVRRSFGRMAPLRHGMFNFAIENQFPIMVAATYGSHKVWPVHQALVDTGEIMMTFDSHVILPRETDQAQVMSIVVRNKMLKLLADNVPEYDPESEPPPIDNIEEYKQLEYAATRRE